MSQKQRSVLAAAAVVVALCVVSLPRTAESCQPTFSGFGVDEKLQVSDKTAPGPIKIESVDANDSRGMCPNHLEIKIVSLDGRPIDPNEVGYYVEISGRDAEKLSDYGAYPIASYYDVVRIDKHMDGMPLVTIVVRPVDRAGNIGPPSEPYTTTPEQGCSLVKSPTLAAPLIPAIFVLVCLLVKRKRSR